MSLSPEEALFYCTVGTKVIIKPAKFKSYYKRFNNKEGEICTPLFSYPSLEFMIKEYQAVPVRLTNFVEGYGTQKYYHIDISEIEIVRKKQAEWEI